MRLRLSLQLSSAILAGFLFAGCDTSAINSIPFESPLSFTSPLPTSAPYTLEIPELADGTGAVHGRLIAASDPAKIFLAGRVYLAPLRNSEGEVSIPYVSIDTSLDPLESRRTADGEFLILDVLPGQYGVVVYTPLTSYLVPGDTNGLLIIEVVAGEVFDLGDIIIN